MKEIIENILKEENVARKRVEEAKEKARKVRLQAEIDAQQMVTDTRVNGQKDAAILIQKVESDARSEREKLLRNKTKTKDLYLTGKKKVIDQTIDYLFGIILGRESDLS